MPEREHKLAGADPVRIRGAGSGEPGRVNPEQRQVSLGVTGDHPAGEFPPVRQPDGELITPGHVAIGDDDAVFPPDDSGATATPVANDDNRGTDRGRDRGGASGDQ